MEVRDTLRGIEIRAAILGLVTLLIGGWILVVLVVVLLLAIVTGLLRIDLIP